MVRVTAPSVAVLILAAVASAPRTADALSIGHDGFGTGGIVATATEAIDVEVIDVGTFDPGTSFTTVCADNQVDACLLKSWFVTGTHTMVVTPDGSSTRVGEFVFNYSDTPWTDYHIAVTGADPGSFGFGFFSFDDDGQLIDFTTTGIATVVDGNSLSLYFADTFSSLVAEGSTVALGVIFDSDGDGTFTIEQYPTFGVPEPATLAVMGLGLVGLVALRRRRSGAAQCPARQG